MVHCKAVVTGPYLDWGDFPLIYEQHSPPSMLPTHSVNTGKKTEEAYPLFPLSKGI